MKMSGKQFKALIKECLKELIQEGHFQQMMMESMRVPHAPSMEQPTPQFQNPAMHNHPASNAISALATNMSKGNPGALGALYEIFSDTAATHPHVLGDRHAQHMGMVQQGMHQYAQENHQPQMLNEHQQETTAPQPPRGEGQFASRWAELAFSKPQTPRRF